MDLQRLYQELRQPPEYLGVVRDFWALRPQFQIHWVGETESTNQTLMAMMAGGSPSGTVVIASTQRAGRGQWGRQWQSLPGGLYLSLGLSLSIPSHRSFYLTLASAWGVATSLANLGVPARVKWPNDIVVGGKKLGGVLAEARLAGPLVEKVIVGLGLNCFNPVPVTGVSLQQVLGAQTCSGSLQTLEGIAAVVLYGLIQGYFLWQTQGDGAFLAAYQSLMTNLGQTVILNGRRATVIGVSTSGNLQLEPDGECLPNSLSDSTILEVSPGKVTLGYTK
ncbi:MAG: biotin--[acetyl-CoA-carboxylase] ligase [Cyanobacteria bacterium REEB459]|nr:biotin--[acetyl-CoA-carboxylase] ligase [Cyanobacteria bacterium REEB459]